MPSFTIAAVASRLDHAVLRPTATVRDLEDAAAMCVARGVGCLCVRPVDVAAAARLVAASRVAIASVVGFPHGGHRPEVKAEESRLAIGDGARELDMVMQIGRFLSGDVGLVSDDIAAVVGVAKPQGVLVKVILETCHLSPEEIATACRIAAESGADFVKTSTGFAAGGATPDAVAVMLRAVEGRLGVKASGGIRSWHDAVAYLAMGCSRLGVGTAAEILDDGLAAGAASG
ncbi:MAG: deoxyribose-phosphate aldolase [Planctomycetia bacterium]|nr:deoxyribose-phosphate aldolase [Planctomycetia bacterium]